MQPYSNNIFRLPLCSVDSSSWVQASQRFGNIQYFDNGIKNRYEINRNLVSLNTLARAFNNIGDDELSKKYRELFENNYSRNAVN